VWKLRRSARIFCLIASARGQRVTKERLIEAIWPEASPAIVRRNFHPAMSLVRRALNHGRQVPKAYVAYEAGGYRLDPSYRYAIDVEELEREIARARGAATADPTAALASYDRAIALYRGPFLEEIDDAWTEAPRAHYAALHREALTESAALLAARGDAADAVPRLESLVASDPHDESASVRLMDALAAAGRRGDVEREFRRLEKALAKAFSVEPSVETRKSYRAALGRSVRD
jgi:DNA-binding SARP family transcriptional activator